MDNWLWMKNVRIGDLIKINWNLVDVFKFQQIPPDGYYIVEDIESCVGYGRMDSVCYACPGNIKLRGDDYRCYGFIGGFPFVKQENFCKIIDEMISELV